jgi:hypothetical protein
MRLEVGPPTLDSRRRIQKIPSTVLEMKTLNLVVLATMRSVRQSSAPQTKRKKGMEMLVISLIAIHRRPGGLAGVRLEMTQWARVKRKMMIAKVKAVKVKEAKAKVTLKRAIIVAKGAEVIVVAKTAEAVTAMKKEVKATIVGTKKLTAAETKKKPTKVAKAARGAAALIVETKEVAVAREAGVSTAVKKGVGRKGVGLKEVGPKAVEATTVETQVLKVVAATIATREARAVTATLAAKKAAKAAAATLAAMKGVEEVKAAAATTVAKKAAKAAAATLAAMKGVEEVKAAAATTVAMKAAKAAKAVGVTAMKSSRGYRIHRSRITFFKRDLLFLSR